MLKAAVEVCLIPWQHIFLYKYEKMPQTGHPLHVDLIDCQWAWLIGHEKGKGLGMCYELKSVGVIDTVALNKLLDFAES